MIRKYIHVYQLWFLTLTVVTALSPELLSVALMIRSKYPSRKTSPNTSVVVITPVVGSMSKNVRAGLRVPSLETKTAAWRE